MSENTHQILSLRDVIKNDIRQFGVLFTIYVVLHMKIDLNSSFRILICSEYQRNLFFFFLLVSNISDNK